jgi:hypothetical protein
MPDTFSPTERATCSGIYSVFHGPIDSPHSGPHQVTVLAGEQFLRCRACGDDVSFTLLTFAAHLEADSVFQAA